MIKKDQSLNHFVIKDMALKHSKQKQVNIENQCQCNHFIKIEIKKNIKLLFEQLSLKLLENQKYF